MHHHNNCKTKSLENLEVGKLRDSWPEFLVGSSQDSEDPEELVDLGIALRDDWH